jgi:hypothetical protein
MGKIIYIQMLPKQKQKPIGPPVRANESKDEGSGFDSRIYLARLMSDLLNFRTNIIKLKMSRTK